METPRFHEIDFHAVAWPHTHHSIILKEENMSYFQINTFSQTNPILTLETAT